MTTFTSALQGCLADKLKEARKGTGFSTREVAERLTEKFQISHATIANYEKGRSQPTLPLLAALAELYDRPMNWFLERGPMFTGIRYRNLPSRVRDSEKHRYEAEALRWLEGYIKIEQFLDVSLPAGIARPEPPPKANPSVFARNIRAELGIAEDAPVPSAIDALEAFGIRVIEVATALRIDGMAAMLGEKPVVVLNPARSDDRIRLNAAHELFHILLGHCGDEPKAMGDDEVKGDEDLAFACARNFLFPEKQLQEAFEGESFVKLVKYKEKFGISIAAMIYAARQEHILTDRTARFLWIAISRRGWREKEPGKVRPDRATRFEQLVDGAIYRKRITLEGAAQLIGVREKELNERLRIAEGITDEPEYKAPLGQEGDDPNFYGPRLAK
jgi:Zn-dependent peptidase ImmA (M78 family)/DNA-binding XRE family transcriptional regulator